MRIFLFVFLSSIRFVTCLNQMFCNKGKADGETKKIKEGMFFFYVNVFNLNQNHLQNFQASGLLKSTKEKSGDTQKT